MGCCGGCDRLPPAATSFSAVALSTRFIFRSASKRANVSCGCCVSSCLASSRWLETKPCDSAGPTGVHASQAPSTMQQKRRRRARLPIGAQGKAGAQRTPLHCPAARAGVRETANVSPLCPSLAQTFAEVACWRLSWRCLSLPDPQEPLARAAQGHCFGPHPSPADRRGQASANCRRSLHLAPSAARLRAACPTRSPRSACGS